MPNNRVIGLSLTPFFFNLNFCIDVNGKKGGTIMACSNISCDIVDLSPFWIYVN